jgi:hypothetical protein
MQVSRSVALIVAALLLTTMSTVAGFIMSPRGYLAPLASPPLAGTTGGIVGTISISNVAPLCRAQPAAASASLPPYYGQIEIVITPSSSSDPIMVPVNWVLFYGCILEGPFRIGLNPGVYSLTITSCYEIHAETYPRYPIFCLDLPKTVIVQPNTWTRVEISLRTGIY